MNKSQTEMNKKSGVLRIPAKPREDEYELMSSTERSSSAELMSSTE